MPGKYWGLLGSLLLLAATAGASTEAPLKTVHVYGPGGPHHVLEECAKLFLEKHGVKVVVIKVLPHDLAEKLGENGDIYYGGAEYMAEEFDRSNPGLLDMTSVEKLHPRRIGVIVRKGNPLNIKSIEDLGRHGIDILDVKLENMRNFHGSGTGRSSNIRRFVYTGQQGIDAWQASPEIDAWVTYKSWHAQLEESADFIEIPGDHALRHTPVALTQGTPQRHEAMQFITFLKSEAARRIFQEHGWD